MSFSRAEWVQRKAEIAERLWRGECGGSYSEAVLILCAAISALAADAWRGKGIDRARFVELLVRLTPQAQIVSIPLLVGHLRERRRSIYARRLKQVFLPLTGSEVVTGPQIDRDAKALKSLCPRLRNTEIRNFSYANLLYERLRSPMVHEYRTGYKTSSFPMTDDATPPVSYFNWVHDLDRHIYFHVPWLAKLVRDAGRRADIECDAYPLNRPAHWWIKVT